MSGHLAGLNPEQRAAVEATEGPLLVLAGAGTGKTRVLTTRFAHLLITGQAGPGQVLAVTFTNKAAREMRERVGGLLGRPVEGLWLGTFHALAARMLRRHAALVGLGPDFTILDADDQLRLLKQVMAEERVDAKRWAPPTMLGLIQSLKDRGLPPERTSNADAGDFAAGRAHALYGAYQRRLKEANAADFGDLLLHTTEILRSEAQVLEAWQQRFRYILVDEYQDTNLVQYYWLRLLAQARRNICCVGDDDQSIYSWRGAEIENILRFEADFPGARVIRLERNYRSSAPILAAAAALIAHNQARLGKTVRPAEAAPGEAVRISALWDSEEEARTVVTRIESFWRAGESLAGISILVRAGFQTRAFEERLLSQAVPYRIVGGLRFYERAEIRDAIAYLRLLARPTDDLAFERIVNVPRRGVGEAILAQIRGAARANSLPLTRATEQLLAEGGLRGRAREALRTLMAELERWRATAAKQGPVAALNEMLEESGYLAYWRQDPSVEAPGRVENLRELGRALADFETLESFLDHVALVMENEAEPAEERVTVMTLHAAKGLEFELVFLPGWEEGIFPNQRALDEGGAKALEEERRLAYVGLTRARRQAFVSFAHNRRLYAGWQTQIPSRFLEELPEEWTAPEGRWPQPVGGTAVFTAAVPLIAPRESPSRQEPARPARTSPIPVGSRVFHQKFGPGVVRAAAGERLEVEFDKAGCKHVLESFLEPVR